MTGTNPIEICTYNYYRGMIFLGLERFKDAIESFRKVLSQPTNLVHQVHQDAYLRVTILNLIVHGQSFDAKKNNVAETVQRYISQEEARKDNLLGLQGMQDAAWQEELVGMEAIEMPNQWHTDLIDGWSAQLPSKIEEAIAKNLDALN